jgi:hypothetical protein
MQEFDIVDIGSISDPYIIIGVDDGSHITITVPPERITRLKGADKVKLTVHPVYKRKRKSNS